MVEREELTIDRVYLVTESLMRPERYVAKTGSIVFKDFARAWDHLLCPMWGDREIYTTHVPIVDLGKFRNDADTDFSYSLRTDRVGWRRVEPEDLTALAMEDACDALMFPGRSLQPEYSWLNTMAQKLTEVRGSTLTALGKEFDSNELRLIFEVLPESLHRYLAAFLSNLKNARDMAEMKTTSYQNEISGLKMQLQDINMRKLESVRRETFPTSVGMPSGTPQRYGRLGNQPMPPTISELADLVKKGTVKF